MHFILFLNRLTYYMTLELPVLKDIYYKDCEQWSSTQRMYLCMYVNFVINLHLLLYSCTERSWSTKQLKVKRKSLNFYVHVRSNRQNLSSILSLSDVLTVLLEHYDNQNCLFYNVLLMFSGRFVNC